MVNGPMEAVGPFANHLPVAVRFGAGLIAELGPTLAGLGARRPFAIVDPAVAELPAVRAALPPGAILHPLVAGEPTIASVDAAGAALAASGADAVVALGGGSALDTAKGARVVATAGGSIGRFAWPGDPEPIPAPALPLVTVPTTAGTGSEVTGGVVMIDPDRGIKVGAPSPHNRAAACLVDPELTHSLPPAPTLYGGLDALAQAIGAVVASTHTPVADGIALEALRLARDALPAVVRDGSDAAARSRMAAASLLAGLAMNLSEVGTDHSLGHALGARHGIPHGLSVALVLAESLDHDAPFVPERSARVAAALDGGGDAPAAVRALLARVGCPVLRDLGVAPADAEALADAALAAWIPVEPGPWTRADVVGAYRRALAVERRTEEAAHAGSRP